MGRLLIQAGADVNVQDNTRQSAYLIPTADGSLAFLRLTLQSGADVQRLDSYNGTGLIRAAGGSPEAAVRETDEALAKQPAVSGSGATQAPGLDAELLRVLDQAEQVATRAGDSYVTVERMLLALTLATTTDASSELQSSGGIGTYAYVSGSATNAPVTFAFDSLWAGGPRP